MNITLAKEGLRIFFRSIKVKVKGTKKYEGQLGAFCCRPLKNKDTYYVRDFNKEHEFYISGMDDSIRNSYEETHPIGTIVTYSYNGFLDSGLPRFARYKRIRDDIVIKNEKKTNGDKAIICAKNE